MKFNLAILTLVVAAAAIPKEPSTEAMKALAEKLEQKRMAANVAEPDCGISSATVFKRDFWDWVCRQQWWSCLHGQYCCWPARCKNGICR
ncbi:Protein of unknown function [Pyronema omphalodes CBS 100304]|uniref:Uncharacterized protein n=1 Tax=Pyronema omphalodes (strain CBS 100304) TaxID=1076935 RepID=U4LI39_PYROM|nr:Protein of unknown function [Pyronema omphalodes CBS 100304]